MFLSWVQGGEKSLSYLHPGDPWILLAAFPALSPFLFPSDLQWCLNGGGSCLVEVWGFILSHLAVLKTLW